MSEPEGLNVPSLLPDVEGGGGAQQRRLSAGGWCWALHQGVRDPYVILVTIYVFGPYVVQLVGDAVRGQQLVAGISLTYGLITAVTAPFIGASIEQIGKRKPALLGLMLVMAPLLGALWWARPDHSGLSLAATSIVLVMLGVIYNWGDVVNNSLLPYAAGPSQTSQASGLGYALASAISVLLLVGLLWSVVLPGRVEWSFVPAAPIFGLSSARGESSRIAGPVCAVVLLLGSIPFYLWTPDAPRRSDRLGWSAILRRGGADLVGTLRNAKGYRAVVTFLGFRMLYSDGMTALLIFGGIYAAGAMKWGAMEMLAFGISQGLFATLGGLLAARLDRLLGARRAVQVEILAALAGLIAMLGMARDRILYVWSFDPQSSPLWPGPMMRSLPELVYLVIGWWLAAFVTAQSASSRTLLVQLAPRDRLASFFGLYAMSGTATVWFGSLLVGLGTALFHSPAGGFVPVVALLVAGAAGLSMLPADRMLERL
jgi:UMF1 family MFS transporter